MTNDDVDFGDNAPASGPGEVEGVDYHFVDDDEFDRLIAAGEFVEWAPVFGHRYGTPKAPVKDALRDGHDILFDIDWQGTQQLHSAMGEDLVRIFILPPSMAELERRLRERGTDCEEVIADRMRRAPAKSAIGPNMIMCWSTRRWTIAWRKSHDRRGRAARSASRQVGLVTFVRDLVGPSH